MTLEWSNGVAELHHGDARELPVADGSVHCVVTSPPYWGLRDYGLGEWEGGDAECDHFVPATEHGPGVTGGTHHLQSGGSTLWPKNTCGKCGAVKQPAGIGLEPTLAEHIDNIVAVGREVRRVLRDDGVFWLNYGDAYAGSWGNYSPTGTGGQRAKQTERWERPGYADTTRKPPNADAKKHGFKPKDLMGLPWRIAFALQDDGWWLRSAIVWHKPNPMPESVRDRPTNAYEMVFLLTKQPRYFMDMEAIRQPNTEGSVPRLENADIGTPRRYEGGRRQWHC